MDDSYHPGLGMNVETVKYLGFLSKIEFYYLGFFHFLYICATFTENLRWNLSLNNWITNINPSRCLNPEYIKAC